MLNEAVSLSADVCAPYAIAPTACTVDEKPGKVQLTAQRSSVPGRLAHSRAAHPLLLRSGAMTTISIKLPCQQGSKIMIGY